MKGTCVVLGGIVGVWLWALPPRAAAEPVDAERALSPATALGGARPWAKGVSEQRQAAALERYLAGNREFTESHYGEALVAYRAAIRSWNHPAIHFNMAVCLINLDQLVEARKHLETGLAYGSDPLGVAAHAQGLTYRKLLDTQLVPLTIASNEVGAKITFDGKLMFTAPDRVALVVLPGEHQVVATKANYLTATETLLLAAGKPRAIDIQPVRAAPPPTLEPCSTGRTYTPPATTWSPPVKAKAAAAKPFVFSTPNPPPQPTVWSSTSTLPATTGLPAMAKPPQRSTSWPPAGVLDPTPPLENDASSSSTIRYSLGPTKYLVPPWVPGMTWDPTTGYRPSDPLVPESSLLRPTPYPPTPPQPPTPPMPYPHPPTPMSGYTMLATALPTPAASPLPPTPPQPLTTLPPQMLPTPVLPPPMPPPPMPPPMPSPSLPAPMHQPPAVTPAYQPPIYHPPTPTYQPPVYRPPTPTYQQPAYHPPTPTYQPPVYHPPTPTYQPPVYRPPTPTYQPPVYQPPTPTYRPPGR